MTRFVIGGTTQPLLLHQSLDSGYETISAVSCGRPQQAYPIIVVKLDEGALRGKRIWWADEI